MQKLVVIKLEGSFLQGFKVNLEIAKEAERPSIELNGELPSALEIPEIYQDWSDSYYHLDVINRLTPVNISDDHSDWESSKINCEEKSQNLIISFNNWLKSGAFAGIREKCWEQFQLDDEIRVIIRTSNHLLRKLPWHLWDLWQKYPLAEVALSTLNSQVTDRVQRQKPRVLIVLGNSQGINVDVDRNLLAQFCRDAEIVFLPEPSPQELNQHLWDAIGWDIILFSGHSKTEGKRGRIFLNPKDSLTMTELNYALQTSVERGLQIGLFNSCDGLGIAAELENLHIPQLIVMRELVPDLVAHQFLKYFLEAYTSGKSLYIAVGVARKKLQGIETNFPCASWLPVIVQNLLETPPTWQSLGVISQCPYRGLAAFREEDASFFFGRESVTSELIAKVVNKPLVALIGASGSGKSSLVFAGLIPNLRKDKNSQWQIISFRPGKNPFESLAVALVSALPNWDSKSRREQEIELEKQLRHSDLTLPIIIEDFAAPSIDRCQSHIFTSPIPRFLLVADQFEELYTLCPDAQRKIFLDRLLKVVHNTPLFTLVFTLRADFLGRSLDYAPLGKALQDYPPELIISMNRSELEQAITLPSQKLNVRLESGLTKAIASDVGDSRGSLPMLQFALAQLWTKQRSGWLTHQAYQEIGGALKALANHAEAVYAGLNEQQRQVAQQVFIQLVQPGDGVEDTRRLATRIEVGEDNWDLVTLLASQRLVVTNCDRSTRIETVEIVHEALISNWGRLRQWINSNREFRIWQERLKIAWHQWKITDFDEDALLRGVSLAEAQKWLKERFKEISPAEREFIEQGVKLREKKKQQNEQQKRRTILGLLGGLVLALGLAGQGVWQWQKAASEQSNSVSISSNVLLESGQDFDALLEAIKAVKQLKSAIWVNPQTRQQVYESLQEAVYNVRERNRLENQYVSYDGTSVDVSPDGQMIVSANTDKTIALWHRDGRKLKTLARYEGQPPCVDFSPDNQQIVSGDNEGRIKLWSINGQLLRKFQGKGSPCATFSPDGNIIASVYRQSPTSNKSSTIDLWSIDGRKLRTLKSHSSLDSWGRVEFSPNGKVIASVTNADNGVIVKLWSVNGRELKTFEVVNKTSSVFVWDFNFSPDGKTIATTDTGGKVKLWNLNGQKLRTIAGCSSDIAIARFNPDGTTIAVGCTVDGIIKLWSVDGQELKTIKDYAEGVTNLIFSADGKSLVSLNQTIKIWDVNSQEPKTFSGKNSSLIDVRFSPDGKTIATVDDYNTITLWNRSGHPLKSIKIYNSSKPFRDWNRIGFSPDGKTIASTSWEGTIKLWSLNGYHLKTLRGQSGKFTNLSFSPDGKTIASTSDDRTIKLWNSDGQLLKTLTGHRGGVLSVSFSPDGKTIASSDENGAIAIWNVQGQLLKMFQGQSGDYLSVSFSPDGKTIASASSDKTLKLWSLDGRELRTFKGHSGGVSSVSFSPDGNIIASSSNDGTIVLWSVISGEKLKTIRGNGYAFWKLSFSPDGKTIASVNDNGLLQLWSTEILDLDELTERGCHWLHDYLKNNPNVSDRDRHLCDGI